MATCDGLSTRQKVALTLGVAAGAAALYICYSKYHSRRVLVTPEGGVELRMRIPQPEVERLMGNGEAASSRVMKETGARLEVTQVPDSDGFLEVTIRGSSSQVHQAQQLISGILDSDTILQVELHLPARSMCRVVGQGGERVRAIKKSSGAKIQCEQKQETDHGQTRCVTITGTWKQVEAAKTLIQKATEEDASMVKRAADLSNFRSHRKEIIAVKRRKDQQASGDKREMSNAKSPPDIRRTFTEDRSPEGSTSRKENIADLTYSICKFEVPSPDFNFGPDEFVDCNVSASENPGHFWIQILGSRSSQLDKLTTEMSDFYQRQKRGEMSKVQIGDIVAAQFQGGDFWYRAEVSGFLDDGSVELYYVDYGDTWNCPKEDLFSLRSDFLSLPFQAVECGLADVLPSTGETWSEQAMDAFDELSYCAKWKRLLAKISSFPSPAYSHFQINLYDPTRVPMVDIGQELVRLGFAIKAHRSPVRIDDDETLVSRLLEEVTSLARKPAAQSFSSQPVEEQTLNSDAAVSSPSDVIVVDDD
ncbi:tudor and KH domain-containing protein isoform X3 [Hyperolius riggenbachi]|uniref:tudor and KH domain-containing protein isoform X3 n=1 Tax=Hyperolius riggenbachi TaxID=752182 RepID=UPI0035A28D9B